MPYFDRHSLMDDRAARPRRQNGGWLRRDYVLFRVRQQAQVGLLRDGGTVAAEVGRYVRQLQNEIDTEIAVRFHKSPKATTVSRASMSFLA